VEVEVAVRRRAEPLHLAHGAGAPSGDALVTRSCRVESKNGASVVGCWYSSQNLGSGKGLRRIVTPAVQVMAKPA
jgi:hypothetical protein